MDWGPSKAGGWAGCWRGDHGVQGRNEGGWDPGRGSRVGKAGSEMQQEWSLEEEGEDESKVVLGFPA